MDEGRTWLDNQQRVVVRVVAGEIEALRIKRQAQWHNLPHPEQKRWTQEELCDVAYPSYKNLLQGRTLHLPTRPQLIHIAAYLECTIHEMNDLLLAAQYLPQQVELREDQYQAALERAKLMVHTLPFPAQVVERNFVVTTINTAYQELLQLESVEQVPLAQRTLANWFFDCHSPYHRIHAVDEEIYCANARTAVAFYRVALQPYRFEPWFRTALHQARQLPYFSTFWDDPTSPWDVSDVTRSLYQHIQPTLVQEHNLVVTTTIGIFPHVTLRVPADDDARRLYQQALFTSEGDVWLDVVASLRDSTL